MSEPTHYGDPFGEQRALAAGRRDVPIGSWAYEALRIAAGKLGPNDVAGPGEEIVFLHLDGSDNVLPQPGDLVFSDADADLPIGRITSVANHYELGPIALAALATDCRSAIVRTNAEDALVAAATQELWP